MSRAETALARVLGALDQAGCPYRVGNGQYSARCPAHDDHTPSLTIRAQAGKVLVCCHAGCATEQVLAALGLSLADLFDQPHPTAAENGGTRRRQIVASYDYTDPAGVLLYQKVRYQPKDFRIRHRDGAGWRWGLGNTPRVLYRLPELLAAIGEQRLVYVVEGEKDADRAAAAGVVATCNFDGAARPGQRPKWRPAYGEQLRGARVVVVVDHDDAGYAHGRAILADLAGKAASVRTVRAAVDSIGADLCDHLDAGFSLEELLDVDLHDTFDRDGEPGQTSEPDPRGDRSGLLRESVATRLVKLAQQRYRLGCTPDGEPYALLTTGPAIVRLLRGGRSSLRAELAHAFYDTTATAASQSALADACTVLEGKAAHTQPEQLHLRVAGGHGRYVLDLGDCSGRAVLLSATGWQLVDTPPVLFKRTALTAVLPEPARGGDLAELWALLNVAPAYRPVLAAVLVAALLPHIPHPILALCGEQGSGKSTAARLIAATLDPSPAQLRKPPRDLDTWTTAAAGSWVVALDNLSTIPDWLSDALCRASTGDGDVRRRLYSDAELHVIAFRRVVLLNGIDLGAVREDLADRLVTVHLDRISDQHRRLDAELARRWQRAHPRVLGALLDLTVQVLAMLPGVRLAELPRMADFALILAAVDQVLHTTGLPTYLGLRTELAHDALHADPVLAAIDRTITTDWVGTAAELLAAITPTAETWRAPKDWPRSPIALRGLLTRRAPALRRLGWTVEDAPADTHTKVKRTRLTPPEQSWSADGTRNPRNPRVDAVSAAQDPDSPAGVTAGLWAAPAGVFGGDTRNPIDTRTYSPPVTSPNGTSAGVAGVAGAVCGPTPLDPTTARALHLITQAFPGAALEPTGTDPRP